MAGPIGSWAGRPIIAMPHTHHDEPRAAEAINPAGNPAGFDERLALLLTAARWLNVVLGLLVLVRDEVPTYQLAGPALLAVAAVMYTIRGRHESIAVPARYVALELAATAAAVVLTGGLNSPLVLAPAVPILLAGYRCEERYAFALAGVAITVTAAAIMLQPNDSSTPRVIALVGVVYLMCGALGAFTRRLVQEIGEQHTEVLEELSRLRRGERTPRGAARTHADHAGHARPRRGHEVGPQPSRQFVLALRAVRARAQRRDRALATGGRRRRTSAWCAQ